MSTRKSAGPQTAEKIEPAPPANPDPASEKDYWHVNYQTRPYYVEGRSFGDYEGAYRYGWESAARMGDVTFEEAEKADLAGGWLGARGETPFSWAEVRDAVRDAWTHARRDRTS
ncbi:MAG: hypothetical protein ACYC4P_14675 [Thermoanaerobaculia bacterium]